MNSCRVIKRAITFNLKLIYHKVSIAIILLFGLNISAQAELICRATDGRSNLFTLGVDTPVVKVTPGIPIGTVLFSKKFDFTTSCSLNKITDKEQTIYFKREDISHALGYGLTLNVDFQGNNGSTTQSVSSGISINDKIAVGGGSTNKYWPKNTFSVDIQIIKTSNSTKPAVSSKPIDLFTMGASSGYPIDSAMFTMDNPDGIVYTTETCKIKGPASFTVTLDKATLNRKNGLGSGVGSNSKSKSFNISLLCDVEIISAFKVMLQLDGASPQGGSDSGLLSLSPNANNAKGVALQVLLGDTDNPVKLGTSWMIGSFPLTGSEIIIPFSARYYQTQEHITPGIANSTMVYTVSYI
jgi:type 1 fimbria pilin